MGLFGKNNEDTKEEEEQKDTYEEYAKCTNCGENNDLEIPIGVKVEDFIKDKKCTNCGCVTLLAGEYSYGNEEEDEE